MDPAERPTFPRLWILPVIWMVLIFWLSGTPGEDVPHLGGWDTWLKKGGHMAGYALLAILWARALHSRFPLATAGRLALMIVVLYAISDEYHQTFVPGRNGKGVDVLVDAAGGLAGLWVWRRSRQA